MVSHSYLFIILLSLFVSCEKGKESSVLYVNSPGNTIYYIDAANGNNSAAGTSETTAWKDFEKVNLTTFHPGDQILLKRGGVWNMQLYPSGSGTAEAPLVIGAYGTGDRPIINGGGIAGAAVYLKNQSDWTIRDLEVTNKADARSGTYRWGILVENSNRGTLSNIKIINNVVHDVTGSFIWADGFIGPHLNGGIALNVTGAGGADKFDNVLIEGNEVYNVGRTGIVVWDNVWNGTGFASTNVKVSQNSVHDIDSDGILTYGCNGAVLEHNLANKCGSYAEAGQFNGTCAIWSTRGSDCINQYNEAANTKKLLDNEDGQGFDIDLDATNCIVQYNYSHDNEGGFILVIDAKDDPGTMLGTTGSIIRFNISQNDRYRIINFAGGIARNTHIYNNTFYVGQGLSTNIIDHSWDLDMTQPYSFKNNIIYNLGTGGYRIPGTNGTFANNHYYGNHPASEPADANKLTSDPMLENPGSGTNGITSVNGYKLKTGSPAIGSGIFIPDNGGLDYFGNVIASNAAPSRGAHHVPAGDVVVVPTTVVDQLNDGSIAFSFTPNITLDGSNPQFFDDASRAARSDGNAGSIVYKFNNITSFAAKVFLFGTDGNVVKWYASADGSNWSIISSVFTTPQHIGEGWHKASYSPTLSVPAGTNYVKVEMTDPTGWAVQIGSISITYE